MGFSAGRRRIPTITASVMREINRSAILELIRCSGVISRSQIAEELGVSLPTVMRIVDELVEDGLVTQDKEKEWSGGRKRNRFRFNGTKHLIIGVDLGGSKIYGAVADLDGGLHHEIRYEHSQPKADESLRILCRVINELLVCAREMGLPVRGIGIGVPGIVQPDEGIVKLAPALDWYDYPLKANLTGHFSYPIVVENDVNLAALGETWFGCSEDENNLVLLTIGTGVGAGIVVNGAVYTGSHYMAGEVGYFLPDRTFLGRGYPGFGAFEQHVSGTGIAVQARQELRGTRSEVELENITAENVFTAARQKEPWAMAILEEVVDYLAHLVSSVNSIIDPDVILLGGGVAKSADLLIEPILQRLDGVTPHLPELRASLLGTRAAIMGAIIRLLRITSDYYLVQKYD